MIMNDLSELYELCPAGLAELRKRWGQSANFHRLSDESSITLQRLQAPKGVHRSTLIVAATCSGQAGDLSALIFEEVEDAREFLKANASGPKYALVTRWLDRFYIVWLRTDYSVGQNLDGPRVSFIAKGEVPVGYLQLFTRMPEMEIALDAPPLEKPFAELIWPRNLEPVFRHLRCSHLYGDPWRPNQRGTETLNPSYWANRLGADSEVAYDAQRKNFIARDEGGQWILLPDEEMERYVIIALNRFARPFGTGFPHREIRLARVRAIVDLMKLAVSTAQPADRDVLSEFLEQRLVKKVGASVTSREVWTAYQAFCEAQQLPGETEVEFLRLLPKLVRHRFRIGKSHSLLREGQAVRGFRNLALVEVPAPKTAVPGTSGTAGTPGPNFADLS